MNTPTTFRWFRQDLCLMCGRCLVNCPVLALPEAVAVAEKKRLVSDAPESSLPFRYCTTCNVCDLACPQNAAPYELVLECYDRQANRKGLPYIARMVLPDAPENIWAALRPLMSDRERELLAEWQNNLDNKNEAVILTGFYTNLVPFLADLDIVKALDLPIAGSEGLWGCGGDTNKMGLIRQTEAVIDLVGKTFRNMGLLKAHCFMQAEAVMLTEVLPRFYGAGFDVSAQPLDYLILDRINSGDIKITHPLNLTVTVHDNCMSRYLNGKPQDVIRRLVEKTGCRIVEMAHNRDRALCCGWAATIPALYTGTGNPFAAVGYLLYSLRRRLSEAEDTGADALVTSCPACYLFLTLIKTLTGSKIEIFHLLELVDRAAGGKPEKKTEERCWEILAHTSTLIFNWMRSPRNRRYFPLPEIDTGAVQPLGIPSPEDTALTKRLTTLYKSRLTQNIIVRRILAATVNLSARGYGIWMNHRKNRKLFAKTDH